MEIGRKWVDEFSPEELARVLFAAVVLGGSTLTLYKKSMGDVSEKKPEKTSKELKKLLKDLLQFDEVYSKWLSENLHRLTDSSVQLLDDLSPDSYQYVRLSIVVDFNYESEKELRAIKGRAYLIFGGGFQKEKRFMFEDAIMKTNDDG